MFSDPQKLKSAIDKFLPILVAVGAAYYIDSYLDFIKKYGNVGALLLLLLLIAFIILWEWGTNRIIRIICRSPASFFVGTWKDIAWNVEDGEMVPPISKIDGGAWINVFEKDGVVTISGYLFSNESLKNGTTVGRFHSQAIFLDKHILKFEYIGGAGVSVPAGFGWYLLVSSHARHKRPSEWRGYFFRQSQRAQRSKAKRVSKNELPSIQGEADMAKEILSYAQEVCGGSRSKVPADALALPPDRSEGAQKTEASELEPKAEKLPR